MTGPQIPQPATVPAAALVPGQPTPQTPAVTVPQPATAPLPVAVPAQPQTPAVIPVVTIPAGMTPAMPGGMPQAVAGGQMNMMDTLRKQVAEAVVSDPRRGLPLGTAIYVVNDIVYEMVGANKDKPLDSVKLTCVIPNTDGDGLKMGEQGYSGALPGSAYDTGIFRMGRFGPNISQQLLLVRCFSGLTSDEIKAYQNTPEGVTYLIQLISLYFGFDFVSNTVTQSCLANMNLVEANTILTIVDSKTNGVIDYDEKGQAKKKTFINTYWNKHIPIAEIWPLFAGQEEKLYSYFGGQDNFLRAWAAQNPTT